MISCKLFAEFKIFAELCDEVMYAMIRKTKEKSHL